MHGAWSTAIVTVRPAGRIARAGNMKSSFPAISMSMVVCLCSFREVLAPISLMIYSHSGRHTGRIGGRAMRNRVIGAITKPGIKANGSSWAIQPVVLVETACQTGRHKINSSGPRRALTDPPVAKSNSGLYVRRTSVRRMIDIEYNHRADSERVDNPFALQKSDLVKPMR